MATRLFVTAAILLGSYASALWVRDRGMPTESAPLEMTPQDLPLALGEWTGQDVTTDPEVFKATGAKMVLDRQYRSRNGQVVTLHIAVFEKFHELSGLPHAPETCYVGAGWHIGGTTPVSLDQRGATGNVGMLEQMTRQGETLDVLYWYQIDGSVYHMGFQQRSLLLACRGRPVLPPVVKVMLQTSAAMPDSAEKTLTSFAAEVFKWTREFH